MVRERVPRCRWIGSVSGAIPVLSLPKVNVACTANASSSSWGPKAKVVTAEKEAKATGAGPLENTWISETEYERSERASTPNIRRPVAATGGRLRFVRVVKPKQQTEGTSHQSWYTPSGSRYC